MKPRNPRSSFLLAAALAVGTLWHRVSCADWPTARGNPQRTGNIDQKPGPKSPKVLWVYEAPEHFVASPVIADKQLFVSGLGAFNTGTLHALSLDGQPTQREIWSKRPPYLKQPVVCSPALTAGKMVFGDGMHQTDGATLHCLLPDTGRPLWQLPVTGTLVHLEGSPTIADGRVFIGGGGAGVLCVDLNKMMLDGQEIDLPTASALIDAKWKLMVAKYEADKKKDPDFAMPPSEDALPKPSPRLLWQAGKDKWHVDSALAVAGQQVFVASAMLDVEKVGDRALLCLDATSGQVKWRAELAINPWSGPTVSGNAVVLGCSSIRFDPKEIPKGKGELVAVNVDNGAVLWKKPVPGGVVAPVTVVGQLVVYTATDGKVRAVGLKDGQEKWTYDAKAPLFSGVAAAADTVYTGDLKGVVHAIDLSSGAGRWKLDLATDPAVKAPGMIYGSPVLHDGRLYLGTCNLDAGPNQQRTVVVCIGQ